MENLFRAAGVKRKDLEDKNTAKLIVDTITANMTAEELAKMPPLPGVTERVEMARARREVQARRAEQAKLMMAMMDGQSLRRHVQRRGSRSENGGSVALPLSSQQTRRGW